VPHFFRLDQAVGLKVGQMVPDGNRRNAGESGQVIDRAPAVGAQGS
jgi:hypothetical protein